jgi:hypothetical protein
MDSPWQKERELRTGSIGRALMGLLAGMLAVAWLFVPVERAWACSCAGAPDEVHYEQATAVFIGTAVERRDPREGPATLRWTFAVESVSKGDAAPRQVVLTPAGGNICEFTFTIGERYQVYASTDAGELWTGLCSGNRALGTGYRTASDAGVVRVFDASFQGDLAAIRVAAPVVGIAPRPAYDGYWLAAADGGVFSFGRARFHGSLGALRLNRPIVGIAATPDGGGYWLVASDGGVFAFGSAGFFGSTGGIALQRPVVGMAPMPDGRGYWLVATDGGIFAFGTARFLGSAGNTTLGRPVVGIAPTPSGQGYRLATADGRVLPFGDAQALGGLADINLSAPITGIASTASGQGYWLVGADGGIFAFGNAPFRGSSTTGPPPSRPSAPVVGISR